MPPTKELLVDEPAFCEILTVVCPAVAGEMPAMNRREKNCSIAYWEQSGGRAALPA
jgi:hypothetical protein